MIVNHAREAVDAHATQKGHADVGASVDANDGANGAANGVANLGPHGPARHIVSSRHYGRWLSAFIVLALVALLTRSLILNPHLEWQVVAQNLTGASIIAGVWMTIKLTVLSVIMGFAGGGLLALMRLSGNPVLVSVSWVYTWLFRSVPMLVQLFVWYNIAALYPTVDVSLPFAGEIVSIRTNTLISPFSAALLALVLHEAAYASEIIRGGIIGVARTQAEAARALGLTRTQVMLRIVLPQAMRTIIPPAGNQVIGQLKTTAVVSVIALQDLLYSAQIVYQRTYEIIPLLLVASLWYIALTSLLSVAQYGIERHFGKGFSRRPRRSTSRLWPMARRRATRLTPPAQHGALGRPNVVNTGKTAAPRRVSQSAIRFTNVVKTYGATRVLDDITLDIKAGKVTVILGPSGSGKSTLLRCVNHLEPLDAGTIHHEGELIGYREKGHKLYELKEASVARQRSRIGMVFQQFHLFPHLNILDNIIEAPMRVRKETRAAATAHAYHLLEQVGLGERAEAWPAELSGGQQQRIAIARALAMRPDLMLFDEPTSALDPERVKEVSGIIKSLAAEGMTLIVVTHEIRFARDIADHVVLMEGGHIIESGTPETVIDNPRSDRARAFLQGIPHHA